MNSLQQQFQGNLINLKNRSNNFLDRVFGGLKNKSEFELGQLEGTALIVSLLQTLIELKTGSPVTTGLGPQAIFSLSPANLNQALVSAASGDPVWRGYIKSNAVQVAVTVPTKGTASVTIPPPDGDVTVLLSDPILTTTAESAGITTPKATVDGVSIVGELGYILGPSGALPMGTGFIAQEQGLYIEWDNPSAADVTVYAQAAGMQLNRTRLYDPFYIKIIRLGLKLGADMVGYQLPGSASQ